MGEAMNAQELTKVIESHIKNADIIRSIDAQPVSEIQ
jgi:uncharacterized radical SAM superfamily Fe-S cluster-containing enzyme